MENRIVFITKSLCYHQVFLSDEMFRTYGKSFFFIQTREPLPFRVAVHQEGFERPYLRGLSRSKEEYKECIHLLKSATVIIVGEASVKLMLYFNKNALLLRYSERIYKSELDRYTFFQKIKRRFRYFCLRCIENSKNSYLLSAGAYTVSDFAKLGLYKGRAYKWGYFPNFFNYDWYSIKKMKSNDKCIQIVWASRLIRFKHPEHLIHLARYLRSKKINFVLHIIGDGDEKSGEIKSLIEASIKTENLYKNVIMHGKIPAENVLEFYKRCDIALFTSSFSEGWGVGVNEAMNAGCAVVAAHSMGSVPYLIDSNKNGIIYEFGNINSLCREVLKLCYKKELRLDLAYNGFMTIKKMWNYENAAKRLSILIDSLLKKLDTPFSEGPCSKAQYLKEEWK